MPPFDRLLVDRALTWAAMAASPPPRPRRLTERLRPWRPLIALVIVALATVNIYMCRTQQQREDDHHAILDYFKRIYPPLHKQTQSMQGALSGLVDDTAPDTGSFAVELLDSEILPGLDRLVATAGEIAPPEEAARELHRDYYHLILSMRDDARAARVIFAGPGSIGEQRRAVHARLMAMHVRFEAFYASVRQRAAAAGVMIP
jgi:hypothetical protein